MTDSDHDTLAPQEANMARKLISRSSLEDGSFLERARAIPGLAVRSDGGLRPRWTRRLPPGQQTLRYGCSDTGR